MLAPTQRKRAKPRASVLHEMNKNTMEAWPSISLIKHHARKRRIPLVLVSFVFLFVFWNYKHTAGKPVNYRLVAAHRKPFPNMETLPTRGKLALGSLSPIADLSLARPSRFTFIAALSNRNFVAATTVIARLQHMKCPVHLLVDLSQAKATEDILKMILPTMDYVSVFQVALEIEGAALASLHHAKSIQTPWVWIMGLLESDTEVAFDSLDTTSMHHLLYSEEIPLGFLGARLWESKLSCAARTDQPEPVAFLVPPFVAPTSLLRQAELGVVSGTSTDAWASLGERIASITGYGMGGVLFTIAGATPNLCETPHIWTTQRHDGVLDSTISLLNTRFRSFTHTSLQIAFALPDLQSMHLLAPTVCQMLGNGHDVYISVQANSSEVEHITPKDWTYANLGCHLHYHLDSSTRNKSVLELPQTITHWCLSKAAGPKVLLLTEIDRDLGRAKVPIAKRSCPSTIAVINLPYGDLQDSEWLGMLTLDEWRAWDTPQIELAVITHDRPWSLARLLSSIKQAHYFGDPVNILINLEQTADLETRSTAEKFSMDLDGGHVAIRHRIVYAGLMAAVVESWYPRGNHSYGVILEDDVELSPMFYAWAKFCVLRYRYNSQNNRSSQLYGVSLYQPKVTELRMEGRRPFDPKSMFAKLRLEHPHTPYLSQVPCSWGAVYFPEHWREFQRYLSLRLSGHIMPVDDVVVPNLRSNKWSRSWKKFFNEMVFLRGYVSLYPNYSNSVSLSTNHLEKGEHVPADITEEKQKYYILPLMPDSAKAGLHSGTVHGVKLLDLPLADLPKWSALPVLDLWSEVSSLEKLQAIGLARRDAMPACNTDEVHQDALQFLCPSNANLRVESSHESPASNMNDDDGLDLMQG